MSNIAEGQNPPTMMALRRAIPAHCFRANDRLSFGYVARDLILMVSLGWAATYIPLLNHTLLRWILWGSYGFVQGLVFVGIWILAHECGHGALFNNSVLNNCFGFGLHSFLLVPFYSWKYTHARHHRYTNHMEKDTAFVPYQARDAGWQSAIEKFFDLAEDTPALSVIVLLSHQLLGWPMYLLFAVTAGKQSAASNEESHSGKQSHFDPLSELWTRSQRIFILLSDIGLIATIWGLFEASKQLSPTTVALLYVQPYLWANHWIVAITYLHHTHPEVAHYDESAWTFQKGALATVDRDFGFIGRHLFHGIIEYHVIHHLFPRIPFYYAEEATESVMPLLSKRYVSQRTPFLTALWRTFTGCKYVAPSHTQSGSLVWK